MINENYLLYLYGISTMVSTESDTDSGLPDPDNSTNAEFTLSNDEVILFGDSDEDEDFNDEETLNFEQYQPLPIEDTTDSNHENSDEEVNADDISSAPPHVDIPVVPIETVLLKEVWSNPSLRSSDIEMDSQKVDEVKQVMASITLPPSSIPEWAAKVPEEHWKQELMERIEQIKKNG